MGLNISVVTLSDFGPFSAPTLLQQIKQISVTWLI